MLTSQERICDFNLHCLVIPRLGRAIQLPDHSTVLCGFIHGSGRNVSLQRASHAAGQLCCGQWADRPSTSNI